MASKFEKLIKELNEKRGRHTELVTVYVPADYSLNKIVNQLSQEKGTAQNIKSKSTRKNVMTALDKIIQHLKVYKKTPENGLALFCGNVSEDEGKTDIQLWAIEPPEPMEQKLYWCDQEFVLEPLEELTKEKEVYGLVLLDKSEADIAYLKGKKIQHLAHKDSIVPGKTRAGGQSSARFQRVREGMLQDWFKEVAETADKIFMQNKDELLGIIIGGPGPNKDDFYNGEYMNYQLQDKIMGVVDTSYTGEHGLEELVERSSDLLKEAKVTKEKEILQKFFEHLKKDDNLATYGVQQVKRAIDLGAVDTVLLSENIDWEVFEYACKCGNAEKVPIKKGQKNKFKCPECGKHPEFIGEMDIDDYFKEFADTTGAEVFMISTDTKEGEQLYNMGGIGALLRFRLPDAA